MDNHPILLEPAVIPGLPEPLRAVPDEKEAWLAWSEAVIAYRELVRRRCEDNKKEQAAEIKLCKEDPAYWLTMYGVLFEPRSINGNKPRWFRWIPFANQVRLIRWIQHVMAQEENGRGDGILEKARDMAASWTFCGYMSWAWLFEDVFIGGVVSRNANQVDRTGASDTLFSKIRALLGINKQVPREIRLPEWMIPAGMTDDHVTLMTIQHPTKTCVLQGETSTELAGVGGRSTMRFNDEAARFRNFDEAWSNQGATSDHRFAVSSADLKSPGFREMANLGREGVSNPYLHAPSYLRLNWWHHPLHDEKWYRDEKARHANDPHKFEREYELDYFAGAGDAVYPRFQTISTRNVPFDPRLGKLYCAIDPGTSDPTAIVWIQEDTEEKRWRVVKGYVTPSGADSDFVASILTGIPISGFGGYDYSDPYLQDLMDWTANLRRSVIYVGDPAGNARGGDGKKTFYEGIRDKSRELTNGQQTIAVRTITHDSARTHAVRKQQLSEMAPKLDFDVDPGAAYVLKAVQESRYPDRSPSRTYTKEIVEPVHDEWSHTRTAMEFWAVNVTMGVAVTKKRNSSDRRSRRISMSGRLMV